MNIKKKEPLIQKSVKMATVSFTSVSIKRKVSTPTIEYIGQGQEKKVRIASVCLFPLFIRLYFNLCYNK